MDISLWVTGAMTLLKPLLEKAGDKAAETIGEKLAAKTIEKTFWQKVTALFVHPEEAKLIQQMEQKPIATSQEVALIEAKLTQEAVEKPAFAADLKATFNLTPSNVFMAELLIQSLRADQLKLNELMSDRRLAGVETEDSFELMVRRTRRRMQKDETELLKILTNS